MKYLSFTTIFLSFQCYMNVIVQYSTYISLFVFRSSFWKKSENQILIVQHFLTFHFLSAISLYCFESGLCMEVFQRFSNGLCRPLEDPLQFHAFICCIAISHHVIGKPSSNADLNGQHLHVLTLISLNFYAFAEIFMHAYAT